MTRAMKWLVFAVIAVTFSYKPGQATTYTAASCNLWDVQTALNRAVNAHHDGDIVSLPAGTCTWTGTTQVSASFTSSVTVQGAGAISATDGGASTTGSDVTVIYEDI